MENIYAIASLWLGLAVLSAVIAHHLRISIALLALFPFATSFLTRRYGRRTVVIPTLIANAASFPGHLVSQKPAALLAEGIDEE